MIVEMDMYYQIRNYFNEGRSIRWISRTLGISRQTVRKYCEGNTHPDVRKDYQRDSNVITDDVREFILSCLKEDEIENLPKQKHSARRIYNRLVEEKGFTGAESTVRRAVRDLKEQCSIPPQADMPLEFDPGDAVQIDWGEVTVYLDGVKTTLSLFCGRLCYSCAIFVQTFYSQNLESFLEAQQRMFDFFGGVPHRMIFDNSKIAVKDGFGLHARTTDGYAAFAAHYAFKTEFCNIASGNEKGLVEGLVNYSRKNFCVPVPRAKDINELNQNLLNACAGYREHHKVDNRSNPVKIDYQEDLDNLQRIPPYRYDTSRTATPRVNDFSLVRFDRNNYSVPVKYVRKEVTVKAFANKINILYNKELIATFDRNYGTKQTEYKLEHYMDLLERKPRSVFQAKPVRATVAQELMDWGKQLPGGNHEMVELLRLCSEEGEEKILSIHDSFPEGVVPTVDMVRSCLHQTPPEPNVMYIDNDIAVQQTDLSQFDKKCGVV